MLKDEKEIISARTIDCEDEKIGNQPITAVCRKRG